MAIKRPLHWYFELQNRKEKKKNDEKELEKEESRKRESEKRKRKTSRKVKRLYGTYSLYIFIGYLRCFWRFSNCQRGCLTNFVVSHLFSRLSLLWSEYFLRTDIPKNWLKVNTFYSILNGQKEPRKYEPKKKRKKQTSIIVRNIVKKERSVQKSWQGK